MGLLTTALLTMALLKSIGTRTYRHFGVDQFDMLMAFLHGLRLFLTGRAKVIADRSGQA